MEATYPAFEPTVVGIDVLDVEDAIDNTGAVLNVERSMGNSGGAGKGGINTGTVRAQNRFRIDQWLEHRDHMRRIEFFQFEVGGLPATVAYHEYRNLLGTETTLAGYAAPAAGRSGQPPLAFEGFEKESFVGLNDSGFVFCPVPGRIV